MKYKNDLQRAKKYKRLVDDQFKGNWVQFFLQWKNDQEKIQKQVIAKLTENANKAEAHAKDIEIQYKNLYHTHLETQKHVELLRQQAQAAQQEKEQKEQSKLKKKQAKKQKIRQTVSSEEFEYILSIVKGRAKAKYRRRLALVLLFLTGLRVSSLLLFKVSNGSELFEKGNTRIPLIKGGESTDPLLLSAKGREVLLQFKEDFIQISTSKSGDMPLFTTNHQPNKPISRETFNKELNSILKQASAKLKKHLRTHSFRASIITELLKYTRIEEVKEIIGHKSISSTLKYKRWKLNTKQVDKILSSLDSQRFQPGAEKKSKANKKKIKGNQLKFSESKQESKPKQQEAMGSKEG